MLRTILFIFLFPSLAFCESRIFSDVWGGMVYESKDVVWYLTGSEISILVTYSKDDAQSNAYVTSILFKFYEIVEGDSENMIPLALDVLPLSRAKPIRNITKRSDGAPVWEYRGTLSEMLVGRTLCIQIHIATSARDTLSRTHFMDCRAPSSAEDTSRVQLSKFQTAYRYDSPERVIEVTDSLLEQGWADYMPLYNAAVLAKKQRMRTKAAHYDTIRKTLPRPWIEG